VPAVGVDAEGHLQSGSPNARRGRRIEGADRRVIVTPSPGCPVLAPPEGRSPAGWRAPRPRGA
jgi:hypothetical protein